MTKQDLKITTYIAIHSLVCLVIFLICIALSIVLGLAMREFITGIDIAGIGLMWFVFVLLPCAFVGTMGACEYYDEFFGTAKDSDRYKKIKE